MGDHGENFAVARIHGDDGAVGVAESELGGALQIVVDGEFQVLAGDGVLGAEIADFATMAVDDLVARAVLPAEKLVVGFFDAGFADDVAGLVGGVARQVQIFFTDFADIADEVSGKAIARIEAALLVDGLEFGQFVAVGFDEGLLVGGDVLLDGDGLVAGRGAEMAKRGAELVKIEVEAVGDQGQVGVDVVALLADQEAGDGWVVVDQQAAVAVEELAARRQDGNLADAVLLGRRRKFSAPSTWRRQRPAARASIMRRMPYCTTVSLRGEFFRRGWGGWNTWGYALGYSEFCLNTAFLVT